MPRYKKFTNYNFEGSIMHEYMNYVGFINCNLVKTDFSDFINDYFSQFWIC